MNALRLAVATTVLVTLCGVAGAETMNTTKDDPLAVPVSGQTRSGERAANPWMPERQAKAQAKTAVGVDPAAVRAAAQHFRSGDTGGPEGATAALVVAADDGYTPIGSQSGSGERAADHWTPERMRAAVPMKTPQLNEDEVQQLLKAGKKNR